MLPCGESGRFSKGAGSLGAVGAPVGFKGISPDSDAEFQVGES